jgi:hypothetical protein
MLGAERNVNFPNYKITQFRNLPKEFHDQE